MADAPTESTSIYARITNRLVAELEQGQLPWRKPWQVAHLGTDLLRPRHRNGLPYTGLNRLSLWTAAAEQGYTSPYWLTRNQVHQLGATIRPGEQGTPAVYADNITRPVADPSGEVLTKRFPFFRDYPVFNANQLANVPAGFNQGRTASAVPPEKPLRELGRFFAQTKADIFIGHRAVYTPATDRIEMPPIASLGSAASYYATLAHELTHWTGHPTRLNRDFSRVDGGEQSAAQEELVAELGACFLAADLGFEPLPAERHAAFIPLWLEVLRNDKRFIFSAAAQAQQAREYLWELQFGPLPF